MLDPKYPKFRLSQVVFLVEALAESPRIARLDLSGNHLSDNVSYTIEIKLNSLTAIVC